MASSPRAVEEPERLLCPITHSMYRDPVFVPESGNTYERSALEQYWATSPPARDPLTNVPLAGTNVHPNWMVRREVQQFLDDHPEYVPQGWPDRNVPSPASRPARGRLASGLAAGFGPRWFWLAAGVVVALILPMICSVAGMGIAPSRRTTSSRAEHDNVTVLEPPRHSLLNVTQEGDHLVAVLPARGVSSEALEQMGFSVFWLGLTGAWTYGAVSGGAPLFFAAFSLPFWGVGASMLLGAFRASAFGQLLDMGKEDYRICSTFLHWEMCDTPGQVADLAGVPLRQCERGDDVCRIIFEDGLQDRSFASDLRAKEATWLQRQLKDHLNNVTNNDSRFAAEPRERPELGGHGVAQRRSSDGFGGFHATGGFGPRFAVVLR